MTLSGSKALSDAWGLFTSRFGPMLAIVALFIVGVVALFMIFGASLMAMMGGALMGGGSPSVMPGSGAFLSIFLLYVLIYALQFTEQAALCRLCSDRHEPSVGDAVVTGLRSVPTLFGVAILAFVGLFVCTFVFGIVGGVLGAATMGSEAGGSIMGLLFAILFMVAGIWLMARLAMILPVVSIEEERNPIAAIAKAWRMSAGSALKIALLLILVFGAMVIVFGGMFFAVVGMPTPGNIPNFGSLGIMAIVMLVLGTLAGNYIVALIAAIHSQLAPTGTGAISEAFA